MYKGCQFIWYKNFFYCSKVLIKENVKEIQPVKNLTPEKQIVEMSMHALWSNIFIILGMNNDVKRASECGVVGQSWQGFDAMEKGRGCEAVDQLGEGRVRLLAKLGRG